MERLLSIVITVLLVALYQTPAFAGSHHGVSRASNHSICTAKSCTQTGLHTHNGRRYTAHYYGDGHTYHSYCTLEDCTVTGYHDHDGTYYFGHAINDGHEYHDYCSVSNCTLTGYHEHDGAYCFSHTINDGHSDHHAGRGHH